MRKIIIAPLNWGLGHATRCIPIINVLQENNFTPLIASDGAALALLRKEFPKLEYLKLPSYNIRYGKNLKTSLLKQATKVLSVVKNEQKIIEHYVTNNKDLVGIISDNRLGVRSEKVPSVYVTHQLNVLSGWTTFFTSKIHQSFIKKFDECWIPDKEGSILSGKLSLMEQPSIPTKYTGILSRFKAENIPLKNDILILLSGPEPNRTSLEHKLFMEFKNYKGKIVLVRGIIEDKQKFYYQGNIEVHNYLLSRELEKELNQSKLIICRSGYSSIMDLAIVGKKAFFIPTKGQNEQEYLASNLETQKIAPYIHEDKFKIKHLENIKFYDGFDPAKAKFNSNLLHLFERERKG